MNTDIYFGRKYDSASYNCAHFVCDVWEDLTGTDIRGPMAGFLAPREGRRATLAELRVFKRLQAPQSPSVVLFQGHRTAPHVGIYWQGRVLHISKAHGVRFDMIEYAAAGAKKTGFYTC